MGNTSARHLAAICTAFLISTAAAAQDEDLASYRRKYLECVDAATARLARSNEAARDVAEAAAADPKCESSLIMIRYAPLGGVEMQSLIRAEARDRAINAVVEQRAAQPRAKHKM